MTSTLGLNLKWKFGHLALNGKCHYCFLNSNDSEKSIFVVTDPIWMRCFGKQPQDGTLHKEQMSDCKEPLEALDAIVIDVYSFRTLPVSRDEYFLNLHISRHARNEYFINIQLQ